MDTDLQRLVMTVAHERLSPMQFQSIFGNMGFKALIEQRIDLVKEEDGTLSDVARLLEWVASDLRTLALALRQAHHNGVE